MHFKSEISKCRLILSNRVSCFEQDGSGQKSQCVTNSLFLEKQNHLLNHQTAYFYQCISRSTKSDPFVQNITNDDIPANSIRSELNGSIRYASNFPKVVKPSKLQRATQFFGRQFTGHLRASVDSSELQTVFYQLSKQRSDRLSNYRLFQANYGKVYASCSAAKLLQHWFFVL